MRYQCRFKCQKCKVGQCYLLPDHEKLDKFKGHYCKQCFPLD